MPDSNQQSPNATDAEALRQREIRSFVLRQGRLTSGQAGAMSNLMPKYGFDLEHDWTNEFKREVVLEIGIGNGDALIACAADDPARDYLGAEVHAPGVGRVLLGIKANNLSNARVFHGDAVVLLRKQVPNQSLAQINIWFPDPWHKARHNKRRLIQPAFVELLADKLKPDGVLHLATDWEPYAEQMREVLAASSDFVILEAGLNEEIRNRRPNTHFERRGLKLGHGVWDLLYRKPCTASAD
jgi:tRNA (guanine-N7-)-methyltransferase